MKKIGILLSLSLFINSCGLYTQYKPETQVPESLFGDTLSVDSATLATLSWRRFFTDTTLQALIDRALERNVDLQTAQLRVQEAEAALTAAKLAYLPGFSFTPQGTLSVFGENNAVKTYTIPATASWELDIFGRITNAKRKSKATLEQSKAYAQAIQTELIATVANLYYTLLMLDAQYNVSIKTEKAWESTLRTSQALKQAGMMTEAGLAQTEATYYTIRTTLLTLHQQIEKTQNALSLILFDTPHQVARGQLQYQSFPQNISLGFPVQLLANRPDVRAAEWTLTQAFYATGQARAAFYPAITLSGTAGWTNSAGSIIVNPAQFATSAIATLVQPIFAKGALRAQYKISKAQQEEARLGFQQTLLNAGVEVNDALTAYQTAQRKSELYAAQVNALERAVKSTSLLMQHGNTTYLEVLTAQQTLLNAQLTQIANRTEEIQNLITLYRALGGGRF